MCFESGRQLEEASQHKSAIPGQYEPRAAHAAQRAILGYTELMADGAYGEPSDKMLGILKPA